MVELVTHSKSIIDLCEKLIGQPGPVTFSFCIDCYCHIRDINADSCSNNCCNHDQVKVGKQDHPITFDDLRLFLDKTIHYRDFDIIPEFRIGSCPSQGDNYILNC